MEDNNSKPTPLILSNSWPSKTPGLTATPYPEQQAVRAGKLYDVAVEFFIRSTEQQVETHDVVADLEATETIAQRDRPRPGLERIQHRKRSGRDLCAMQAHKD